MKSHPTLAIPFPSYWNLNSEIGGNLPPEKFSEKQKKRNVDEERVAIGKGSKLEL
jgi:hypothetical protein